MLIIAYHPPFVQRFLKILVISAPLVLAGCSSLKVTPATEHATSGEVCITPDMSGRKVAYQCTIKALQNKGFTVREVSQAECRDCRVVLHCQTTSRWDLANFTSDINYEWIEDGQTIAKAKYHAKNGLNFNKYINTQEKVNSLLNQMLPNTPALPSRYDN